MKIIDHWLDSARREASPNHDARPVPNDISLIILHYISLPPGQFGSEAISQLFSNTLQASAHPYFAEIAHLRVSAHILIRRTGEIIQYVPFDQRAWHAGLSSYHGRMRCNDFSVGLELEGTEDLPFSHHQYDSLIQVLEALIGTYPCLSPDRIIGHSDVAPGRKTDPGPYFDWSRLLLANNRDSAGSFPLLPPPPGSTV